MRNESNPNVETARELYAKYNDRAKTKAALVLTYDLSEKEATELLKEAKIARTRGGLRSELYTALRERNVSVSEFRELLKTASRNELKYESHYNEIRELVNAVRKEAAKS